MAEIIFADLIQDVAEALAGAFAGVPDVAVYCGSIFDQTPATAIISPANSFGSMGGGIDLAYARRWPGVEARVQTRIATLFGSLGLPVGAALTVPTEGADVPWLVVAPTMRVPGPVTSTRNAFMAMRAALQQARMRRFDRVLCPGLGTLTGRIPPRDAARQMREAYDEVMP